MKREKEKRKRQYSQKGDFIASKGMILYTNRTEEMLLH